MPKGSNVVPFLVMTYFLIGALGWSSLGGIAGSSEDSFKHFDLELARHEVLPITKLREDNIAPSKSVDTLTIDSPANQPNQKI